MNQEAFIEDVERYAKASRPHESVEDCNKAIENVFDEVMALREKYHIENILVVYTVNINEEGNTGSSMGMFGGGNHTMFESMAAFAFGAEKQRREEKIRGLLSGKDT